jgi:hypothetical protein
MLWRLDLPARVASSTSHKVHCVDERSTLRSRATIEQSIWYGVDAVEMVVDKKPNSMSPFDKRVMSSLPSKIGTDKATQGCNEIKAAGHES